MQKIYYDISTGKQVVDGSGVRPVEEIEKEFGFKVKDIQVLTLSNNENTYTIEDGKLKEKIKIDPIYKEKPISLNEALEIVAKLKDSTSFDDFKSKITSTEVKEK